MEKFEGGALRGCEVETGVGVVKGESPRTVLNPLFESVLVCGLSSAMTGVLTPLGIRLRVSVDMKVSRPDY